MKSCYKISAVLLTLLSLSGIGASASQAHASHVQAPQIARSAKNVHVQAKKQAKPQLVKVVKKQAKRHHKSNWFRDGLSHKQLKARNWVTTHESGDNWSILSYGHVCVGYFQLSPSYLGYRHGHVNLNHKHQVKVADAYVANRYGSWVNAKHFWQAHHWY